MSLPYSRILLKGPCLYLAATILDDLKILEKQVGIHYLRLMMLAPAFPPSIEAVLEQVNSGVKTGHELTFTIRLHEDQRPIGLVSLQHIDFWGRNASLSLGIMAESDQGQGYGREALTLLLQYAFWELNLNRVWLEVADYNQAAKALYAALGFVQEVTLRQYIFRDGVYYNAHIMSLLAAEWAALRQQGDSQ